MAAALIEGTRLPMIHIPKSEYARRRKALMAQMEPNSIAILPAAAVAIRNRDVEHVYRQDSDFQYLSGFPEPEAVVVLIPGREYGEYVLFCRERNPQRELWDGLRAGQEGAIRDFGADDAFPIADIDEILPGLIEGRERVYSAMGSNAEFDRHLMDWINVIRSKAHLGAQPPNEFVALDHLLHDMRLYKSTAEIKVMREAAQISARAHVRAMQACRPGLYEFSIEAELDYEFRKGGAKMPAYGSIVASGRNACILHYQQNDAPLKDGDLVLIDAGCEIDCYASDITRTFPVSGKFSTEQKAIYELVLKSQEAAFAAIGPDKHWNQAHEATVRVITEGLVELGLLQGDVDELIANEAYKTFYMHRAGHWLGMDVHDVGDYKVGGEWRVLEVGMTLTVEPGIYISPDNQQVAKKWRGIGVRIEDDVVVTRQGCEILTNGVPKTVAQIEALMAAARSLPEYAA
jgi:Xaa-Pro aminopeptidase